MTGRTISHYRIDERLGEGGMGVVYRAGDLNLQRTVALKFLSANVLDDPESEERLLREARAAAGLDHPNVCTVYEIGRHDGQAFLAMAYVEGRTVRQKIAERPLKLDEALDIAIQAAEGLAAAHERNVVHRDVKSANLMVTPQGVVKVMDFGLALLSGQTGLTKTTSTLGTAAYMSPEQAQHQLVDHRTDIWSLGVVIYEMLAGRVPFQAEHEVAALYAIVHQTPEPVTALRAGLPVAIDRVLGKAMAKDPRQRYQHMEDMLVDLRALRKGLPVTAPRIASPPGRRRKILLLAGVATLSVAVIITAYAVFKRSGNGAALRAEFTQLTSEPGVEWFPSLSPDGKWLIYGAETDAGHHIFLRSVGGQNALDLTPGSTDDNDQPAFSPDGESIAFRSSRGGGGIFVMGRTGEAVRRVTGVGFNPAWSPDGRQLVFSSDKVELYPQNVQLNGELWTTAVDGGEPRRVFAGDTDAVTPSWSPHKSRIAFANRFGKFVQGDVWTVPAAGGTPVRVTNDPARDWNPVWSPDGKYLFFVSDRGGSMNLWRVRIDEGSGKTEGQPEAITTPAPYLAHLSLSADGKRMAFASTLVTANIQQLSLDASGTVKGEPSWVTSGTRRWANPDPSPDGEWVAFYSLTQPEGQLYVAHPDGSGLRQITRDAVDRLPRWSPDGQWIGFFSDRSRDPDLWRIRPDGSGLQQLTKAAGTGYFVWSPDSSRIATTAGLRGGGARVLIFDPNRPWDGQTPEELPPLDPPTDALQVQSWSPDSRRLAGSEEGARPGIVAYSLDSRAYERISEFGEWPAWLSDSRRFLFVAGGKAFYLADSRTRQARKIFSVTRDVIGPPRPSRDGSKIYFPRRVTESDIWLCTLR